MDRQENSASKYVPRRFDIGIVYELYMPKKMSYQRAVLVALEGGFRVEEVLEVVRNEVTVKERLANHIGPYDFGHRYKDCVGELEFYLRNTDFFFKGFSSYEVDGVFAGKRDKPYEERVLVYKIIFRLDLDCLTKRCAIEGGRSVDIGTVRNAAYRCLHRGDFGNLNIDEFCIDVFGGLGADGARVKVATRMYEWHRATVLFVYGYLMEKICSMLEAEAEAEAERRSSGCKSNCQCEMSETNGTVRVDGELICEDPPRIEGGEEEIWLTSYRPLMINRLIR